MAFPPQAFPQHMLHFEQGTSYDRPITIPASDPSNTHAHAAEHSRRMPPAAAPLDPPLSSLAFYPPLSSDMSPPATSTPSGSSVDTPVYDEPLYPLPTIVGEGHIPYYQIEHQNQPDSYWSPDMFEPSQSQMQRSSSKPHGAYAAPGSAPAYSALASQMQYYGPPLGYPASAPAPSLMHHQPQVLPPMHSQPQYGAPPQTALYSCQGRAPPSYLNLQQNGYGLPQHQIQPPAYSRTQTVTTVTSTTTTFAQAPMCAPSGSHAYIHPQAHAPCHQQLQLQSQLRAHPHPHPHSQFGAPMAPVQGAGAQVHPALLPSQPSMPDIKQPRPQHPLPEWTKLSSPTIDELFPPETLELFQSSKSSRDTAPAPAKAEVPAEYDSEEVDMDSEDDEGEGDEEDEDEDEDADYEMEDDDDEDDEDEEDYTADDAPQVGAESSLGTPAPASYGQGLPSPAVPIQSQGTLPPFALLCQPVSDAVRNQFKTANPSLAGPGPVLPGDVFSNANSYWESAPLRYEHDHHAWVR
ncbi:hypothetical protein DENSPDRAFT_113618 [Dentipellis sp. KUC8613]|nr:hypothetical protein DENSPDRAFT_113618 [Dentipellis sp. KUC8613]